MTPLSPTSNNIRLAAEVLRDGRLIGLPTETVYGLAADASDPVAVAKIFAAKGRPADHPLIVHLTDLSQVSAWAASFNDNAQRLAAHFWPGPLTLILPRHPSVLDEVTGGQDTVGLRVPAHPVARAVLQHFGGGVAAPSANRFGRISPTQASHVIEELGDQVACVLDGGACDVGIESTIVDLSSDCLRILRLGGISAERIRAVLCQEVGFASAARSSAAATILPRVSGSLSAHYAPRTALRQVNADQLDNEILRLCSEGQRVGVLALKPASVDASATVWQQMPDSALAYAQLLYAQMRAFDGLGLDLIVVQAPPPSSEWAAVLDRLQRASVGSG